MLYFNKIYRPIQSLFPQYTWRIKSDSKTIYFTFDDGPCPGVTDEILTILQEYKAKATFFCIGNNVEQYPILYQRILDESHTVGNHSYSHASGWKMKKENYLQDVAMAKKLIDSNLYRPPYGRLTRSQAQALQYNYSIVMWDVMPGDFDPNISADQCYSNIIKNTSSGSIIVLHDSEKAKKTVLEVLPKVLNYYNKQGYDFKKIPTDESIRNEIA